MHSFKTCGREFGLLWQQRSEGAILFTHTSLIVLAILTLGLLDENGNSKNRDTWKAPKANIWDWTCIKRVGQRKKLGFSTFKCRFLSWLGPGYEPTLKKQGQLYNLLILFIVSFLLFHFSILSAFFPYMMTACHSRFTEHFDMSPSLSQCPQWSPSKSSFAFSTESSQKSFEEHLSSSCSSSSSNSPPSSPTIDDEKQSMFKFKKFFRLQKKWMVKQYSNYPSTLIACPFPWPRRWPRPSWRLKLHLIATPPITIKSIHIPLVLPIALLYPITPSMYIFLVTLLYTIPLSSMLIQQ